MMKLDLKLLIVGIAALVFLNVLIFIVPFSREATFWVGYIFLMIALLAQTFIVYVVSRDGLFPKSGNSRYPLVKTGLIYLIIQVVLSIVLFILDALIPVSWTWLSVLLCLLVFGIFIYRVLIVLVSLKNIDVVHETVVENTQFIDNLLIEINSVRLRVKDSEIAEKLVEIQERVRLSDPVSPQGLRSIESEISEKIGVLKFLVTNGDKTQIMELLEELRALLDDRSTRCKMMK